MIDFPTEEKRFEEKYPEIFQAHRDMAQKTHLAGPLDDKTRRLVKLGVACGAGIKGAVKSHARRARSLGITDEEIRHAVILSTTTIGFPSMISTVRWVEEALEE